MADLTRYKYIGQEVHLNLDNTVTRAGFTTATLDIEAKAAFFIAPNFGFIGLCKEITNIIEDACISCRIGTRSPTDRALVNVDQAIDVLNPLNGLVFPWFFRIAVELLSDGFLQDPIDQG